MTRTSPITGKVLTAACLLSSIGMSPAAANESFAVEPVVIRDPVASGEGRNAVRFLKPVGWKVEGGIVWYPNHAHQACAEIRVRNPRGPEQIEVLPVRPFAYFQNPVIPMARGQNYLGCDIQPPTDDPKVYVRDFVLPYCRKGVQARIVDFQDQPEVVHAILKGEKVPRGTSARAGRVRINYVLDGNEVEEDIYVSLGVVANPFIQGAWLWGAGYTFALRAAKGELDAMTRMLHAVIASAEVNPEWSRQHAEVVHAFRRRMQVGIDGAVQISIATRKAAQEIAQIYNDSYWNRQRSQDRAALQFSQYLRGAERFDNPFERQPVDLPTGFKYAWASSDGRYLLTDNTTDPNVGSTQTWRLLKRTD